MPTQLIQILLLSLLSLHLIGCDSGEKNDSVVIPIKGDPMAFVKGTQMDTSQGLKVDTTEGELWRIHVRAFTTEEQEKPALNQNEIENKNKAATADEIRENLKRKSPAYYFEKTENGYVLKTDSSEISKLYFKETEGKLYFDFASYKSNVYKNNSSAITMLHYSANTKGDKFSLLFKGTDQNGAFLVSYTFDQINNKDFDLPQVLSDAYIYLMGEGVKISWPQDKPLNISNCKSGSHQLDELTQAGFKVWEEPLEGRLTINSELIDQCPPFSDVNSVGVYHIKDWVEILGESGIPAFVIPTFDLDTNGFLDSDMFFLHEEYNESIGNLKLTDDAILYNEAFATGFKRTSAHEMGHILGLAHQFTGVDSIMSYKKDRKETLEEYDIEAIQALYPLK